MLWMLGVVAILVDVVSRFAGSGPSSHVKVHIETTTTIKPKEIFHPTPTADVTYIVINEKIQRPPPIEPLKNKEQKNEVVSDMTGGESEESFPASPILDDKTNSLNVLDQGPAVQRVTRNNVMKVATIAGPSKSVVTPSTLVLNVPDNEQNADKLLTSSNKITQ